MISTSLLVQGAPRLAHSSLGRAWPLSREHEKLKPLSNSFPARLTLNVMDVSCGWEGPGEWLSTRETASAAVQIPSAYVECGGCLSRSSLPGLLEVCGLGKADLQRGPCVCQAMCLNLHIGKWEPVLPVGGPLSRWGNSAPKIWVFMNKITWLR